MHRKLATRDEYLYSQREKYTNLFELYSSQYQQLLNSEFITTNTIDINDEDLSDNIAKYIHYINNISPLIGNIEQDSEIPTNIDSINIQPSLDTANLYNSQMNEKKSLAESIEKLTFPSQASINTHKKLIIEKSVNELKGYLNNLKERRLDIEILTGSYSKESYIKFQDFSNQELNERVVNLKNYRGNLEINLKNFIKIQDFTKQKLGKIDKNIIIGGNIEEYNKFEIFSKNTYAKSYINNFNEYLNDKNIAKPKFESNKLENGDNTFFPNGYNIDGETVIKDNLEELNNHHQDRLEATDIITFIENKTDFYNILKIQSPSLTADTFRQKLHSMKLEDLKNIKQLDNKFDTLDHEHKNWKTKSDNNIKFIRHHQKLVASYKLASSIKEDISKYTQYRREFSKNIASTSTNYDKLSGLDTNKIKATILSDIILDNKNSKGGLKKLEDELNDIDNGVNDINTKTETAKSFQTEIDAFINAKMNGVDRKIAKKEGKAYQPATKEENVIKFKFANNLIITSMKTKLSALNDFMSKTDLKEKYSELLDISEKTVEQLSIEEVEKMDHLYNELLEEFKPNGESDCVGMCKYIDSWTKNANSGKDGKSSELSSSYIYTSWIKRNNFLSKRSLTIGATKYIGTKALETVATDGLTIPLTIYELGEKVFNSRNAIGELNNAFDRLVEASDVIETYLNYDDDSNIIEAIDYIHGIRDTVSIVDDYLGGKKTRDMDWSKLYKITEDKLSDSLDNSYSKRKGSYTNRDYFDLENFFLLSALEAGDAGKEKAIDKLGDIFKFFNSGDDKPPKSKILNEKVNTVKVWDAVTEASEIFEKAVGFGKAGEYLHLGHNLDKKIKVDEFYSVGTQMKGSFDTFHEELDSDYQGMIWHSNNNNDPTQTSKKGAIWSDFDFTRAQHDLRDIKERNKHRERSKKYIGIDPNSGEHINKDDMEKERYLKRQTAEVVANLDPVKKFIRKVQDDHVLSNYKGKELHNYRKYIEHLDSKETIPNNEKLNQEELDVALNIVNDNSFPTQESIYSGDVHIESDKLFGRYNIGDTVDIKLRTWSKYFTGKITSRNSDGTFNVKTDDNSETELNINSEYIKTEHDSIFGGNPDVKSMSFKDAVFYGLQLESQRKINVLIKNPITYEDELMRTRVASDSRNVHGFRLDSELSFLDDYNYRYLSSEGTISGLNNLGIDTRDMFELGKNNKITGIESITLDGEIRFLYSKSSKEDDAISNIASDGHFFGEFGKKRDTSLDGNINNIRQKFYEHSSDRFKGIENADSSLLWKRILMENSIKINRDNDPEKMDRLMSLLGITGDSKENDRAILESKGLSWCKYKSECDITKEQKFTFVDDNDVSHNIIIKGDIFYQGHYIFYQNEIEIDVTTDDWDSLIKLKEYLYGY